MPYYLLGLIFISRISDIFPLPSIITSSVFDSEVTIVSYALWPRPLPIIANHTQAAWLFDVLDKLDDVSAVETDCVMSLAMVGQHTNPTGHDYDLCSNKQTKQFKLFRRRIVADASPYLRKDAMFSPVVIIDNRKSDFQCSYFHWARGVGYVVCPLKSSTCQRIKTQSVNMSIHSAMNVERACQNPIRVNFTTQALILRQQHLHPVNLSICIYSGFRPHENTRFHGLLEANIEYHRKLGVQRFYILDRNSSHQDLFDR